MKLATLEAAITDWLMKVVMPTLPWYVDLLSGFAVPAILMALEEKIEENSSFLKKSGAIKDDNTIDPVKLREAMDFPFKYRDKIAVKMPVGQFYINRQNVEEIISTAEQIENQ